MSLATVADALAVALVISLSLWVLRRRLMRPACGKPPRAADHVVRRRTDELGIGRRVQDQRS